MDPKLLEKIGLTHNESIVYLTLLRIGTSKTGEILNKSNLNSGRIYEILESLKIKGMVSESEINNVRNFSASSPKGFIDYIEKKKEELNTEEKLVKRVIPEMEKIRNLKEKQTLSRTYLGLKGLKSVAYECLEKMNKNEEILTMGITAKKPIKFNIFWDNFTKKRIKQKIKAKRLISEESDFFNSRQNLADTKTRVLKGITPAVVDIYGKNKMLIINYDEPCSVILIHDQKIVESFIHFFYQLWKLAK